MGFTHLPRLTWHGHSQAGASQDVCLGYIEVKLLWWDAAEIGICLGEDQPEAGAIRVSHLLAQSMGEALVVEEQMELALVSERLEFGPLLRIADVGERFQRKGTSGLVVDGHL